MTRQTGLSVQIHGVHPPVPPVAEKDNTGKFFLHRGETIPLQFTTGWTGGLTSPAVNLIRTPMRPEYPVICGANA